MRDPETLCPSCGAGLHPGTKPCPDCGSILAGMSVIAREAMREEALLPYQLLISAGLHPALAYSDESDVHHPIEAEEPFTSACGLMVPATVDFLVYVARAEETEARRILDDARRAGSAAE